MDFRSKKTIFGLLQDESSQEETEEKNNKYKIKK